MTHVDETTARDYRGRTLTPDALLDVASHLAECEECRARLRDGAPSPAALADALTVDGPHATYEQLEALVDGTVTRFERPALEAHLASCPDCTADLDDLRKHAVALARPRRRPRWAIAAAIAAAVLLPLLYLLMRPAAPVPPRGSMDADAALLLRDARNGRVAIAPRAVALRRERGTLMGTATAAFDVLAPQGTLVRETRPHFAWHALAPETAYRVEIYDGSELVAASPALSTTEWTCDRDLARGRDYIWQVVASRGATRTTAPRPPAPEARFGIVDDAAAARLADAERRYATTPLLRALVAAREGLLDEARAQLAKSGEHDDPRATAALREALR